MKKSFLGILVGFLFIGTVPIDVVAASEDDVSFLIGADDQGKVKELQTIIPNKNVEFVPEVGLVTIKSGNNSDEKKIHKIFPGVLTGNIANVKTEDSMSSDNQVNSLLGSRYEKFNWAYKRVLSDAPENRNFGKESKIAIVDSGIDLTHPELINKVVRQTNYTDDDDSVMDGYGHGTLVAGVIDTLAPKASIYSYKVMNREGGESTDIIKAIIDAVNDGVDVVNISLGTIKKTDSQDREVTQQAFERTIEYAAKNKIFIVASAGNENRNLDDQSQSIHFPGGMKGTITVAATQKNGNKASYSNYGDGVTIAAPAGDFGSRYLSEGQMDAREMMVTYYPTQYPTQLGELAGFSRGYTLSLGTSLAAPQVTSALASILSNEKSAGISKESRYNLAMQKLYENSAKFENGKQIGFGEVRIKE